MEEKILEILSNSYDECTTFDNEGNILGGKLEFNQDMASEKISQLFKDFINWLAFDGLEIFPMTGKTGDNEVVWFDAADGENTLEEVYQYWIINIKNG